MFSAELFRCAREGVTKRVGVTKHGNKNGFMKDDTHFFLSDEHAGRIRTGRSRGGSDKEAQDPTAKSVRH